MFAPEPSHVIKTPPPPKQVRVKIKSKKDCDCDNHRLELLKDFDGKSFRYKAMCYKCGRVWEYTVDAPAKAIAKPQASIAPKSKKKWCPLKWICGACKEDVHAPAPETPKVISEEKHQWPPIGFVPIRNYKYVRPNVYLEDGHLMREDLQIGMMAFSLTHHKDHFITLYHSPEVIDSVVLTRQHGGYPQVYSGEILQDILAQKAGDPRTLSVNPECTKHCDTIQIRYGVFTKPYETIPGRPITF